MRRFLRRLAAFRRLARHERLSRAEVERLREQRFRDLLHHAWDETEFYPRYYREHGLDRDDLATVPVEDVPPIDKSTYVDNFDDLTTDDALTRAAVDAFVERTDDPEARFSDEYTVLHTSGTTGEPTYFVYHEDAWDTVLAGAARALRGDMRLHQIARKALGGIRIAYVAATRGRFGGVMAARAGLGVRSDTLLLDINRPLDEWEAELRAFDPNVVVGYPSAIKLVCDIVADGLALDPFRVVTGGEPLSPALREYVRDTLGTEVFDFYGACESLVIGLERGVHDGMFLYDDLNYVEPAEKVTYVTPLYNRRQPLIRYELDDKLAPAERTGDEPLPFTTVESVVGRSEEIMWFETDGTEEFLHPLVIDELEADGLTRYQFVQRSDDRFDVRVELRESADRDRIERAVRDQLDAILAEKGLTALAYDVVEVDDIPVDPETGKRKMVVTD